MHLSIFRQYLGVAFTLVVTVSVSALMNSEHLYFSGNLSESTLASNAGIAFTASLLALVLAGIMLGLLAALQTFSSLVLAAVFYPLGLFTFMVMDVGFLNYTWPLTGIVALGVLYVLYSYDEQAIKDDLQPLPALPNRDVDSLSFRRSLDG